MNDVNRVKMNKRITIELDTKSYDYFMEISLSTKRKKVLQEALKLYRIRVELDYNINKVLSLLTRLQVYISVIVEFSLDKKEKNSAIGFTEKASITIEEALLLLNNIKNLLHSDDSKNEP